MTRVFLNAFDSDLESPDPIVSFNLRMSHFFFGITSTDFKKKTFFF